MSTDEVAKVASIEDRVKRLRAASDGVSTAQRTMTELARLRRSLVQELHDEGWTYAQIAQAAGLSRGRVHQVRHQGPAPEGAFFGRSPLRIATPLKREERRARPVVAAEDVTAQQRLTELARTLGFEVDYEQIPLSGDIDLNRDGLVVICGPRISRNVAAVLDTDPDLRFTKLDTGWALEDRTTGQVYKAGPDDDGRPYDVAYLGRLNRPDGNGMLIVFTGIHPPGSLGVVDLLTNKLAELHRDARKGPFSVLVGVEYDENTHEPVKVDTITPVHRHGN
jgi:Sigma-70, region 4